MMDYKKIRITFSTKDEFPPFPRNGLRVDHLYTFRGFSDISIAVYKLCTMLNCSQFPMLTESMSHRKPLRYKSSGNASLQSYKHS
ncbi:unnamed protein product [Clavelina lepadiformis]|uniref:Uncharacterized protein n=1 Tax=Clavelina lepadiformis TaxID=159417 RepID=A0ABP0FET7_CLALP